MKKGKRYLVTNNGVQFAGTFNGDGLVSDINGDVYDVYYGLDTYKELKGIHAARVGDVIVDGADEAKILAIDNSHTAFLRSGWGEFDSAYDWFTFTDAENEGWKLKDQPDEVKEMTVSEISKQLGYEVKVVKGDK